MNKPPEGQTAESRYKRGMANRQTYLTEAHKSSQLTLPSLIPDTSDICDRESPVELNKLANTGTAMLNGLGAMASLMGGMMSAALAGETQVIAPDASSALPGTRSSPKRQTMSHRLPSAAGVSELPRTTTTVPPALGPLLGVVVLTTGGE